MTGSVFPALARPVGRALARPGRSAWSAAALLWAAAIFALSSRPAEATGPEPFLLGVLRNGVHAPLYAFLGAFLLLAFVPRNERGPGVGSRWIALALLLALLFGGSDEWHQSLVPGRHPSLLDLATDGFGAAFGASVVRWALLAGAPGPLLWAAAAALGATATAALAASGSLPI